mmetsp:Transcript_16926/g.43128  ORF Transcript_16926/g.43128 Transcript_16926/m.43128 type:complete len:551 (-) Transcript_16926:297-1949(-)
MGQSFATKRVMMPDVDFSGLAEQDASTSPGVHNAASACGGCWEWLFPQHGGQAVVVVDPYSSGRFLLYELKARKMPIICVRSSLELGAFFLNAYKKNKPYFSKTVDFQNMTQLVSDLRGLPYDIVAVFGGSEPGVELADQLAEALGLVARNPTSLTRARKDKAEMQERLRECGVPAAEQVRSGSLPELLAWARAHGRWPLVAKPTGSSGSDGIFFCQGLDDIEAAHSELIGKKNPNGLINCELALQEFLAGTEYIVDTVSHEGKHLCVAIWVYTKRKGVAWNPHCIVSEGNRLLPSSGEVQDVLTDYAFRVLDAVGLQYGPCHTEIMLTPRGPILVEVNARLHGLQGPHLIGLSTGTSQATYAVDALVDNGHLFNQRHVEGPARYQYPLEKHCLQLVLISPVQGYLSVPISKTIQRLGLRSVVEVLPSVQKGQHLSQTSDLNTAAGYVLLVHESSEQIEADRLRIREAEESGQLYMVSPTPLPESPLCSPQSPGALRYTSPVMQSMEKAEEVWEDAAAGIGGSGTTTTAVPIDGETGSPSKAAAFQMSGL